MIKKILLALAVIVIGFLSYVAVQPSDYLISRETLINSSPDKIFPHINNSKKANEWMPWRDADPTVQMNYSGPEEGVGSKSSWDSKGQMGKGEAVVVDSQANQSVKTQLTYERPFTGTQTAEISLAPEGAGTKVRWQVSGQNNFVGRVFCVFMNMDKMVGGSFEKGLATLKLKVESGS